MLIKFGLLKDESGELVEISSIEKTSSDDRIMEVFGLSGEFSSSFRAGVALHADVFAGGIRLANVGVSAGAEMGVNVSGDFGYGTNNFSDPWSFEGQHCVLGRIGAGVVFTGAARLGVEIPTRWKDINSNFEYSFEYPDVTQRSQEGRNGLWFNRVGVDTCNNQTDITNGLVAHYKFDGNAEDSSGNNNHGIAVGGVTYALGIEGQAARFDGNDYFINISSSPSLNQISTNLSVSTWVSWDGTFNGASYILDKFSNKFNLALNGGDGSSGKPRFVIQNALGINDSPTGISANKWHHITGTYDGSMSKLYINGLLVSTETFTRSISSGGELRIGCYEPCSSDYAFDGLIDDLRIYNRPLTETEIGILASERACLGTAHG